MTQTSLHFQANHDPLGLFIQNRENIYSLGEVQVQHARKGAENSKDWWLLGQSRKAWKNILNLSWKGRSLLLPSPISRQRYWWPCPHAAADTGGYQFCWWWAACTAYARLGGLVLVLLLLSATSRLCQSREGMSIDQLNYGLKCTSVA